MTIKEGARNNYSMRLWKPEIKHLEKISQGLLERIIMHDINGMLGKVRYTISCLTNGDTGRIRAKYNSSNNMLGGDDIETKMIGLREISKIVEEIRQDSISPDEDTNNYAGGLVEPLKALFPAAVAAAEFFIKPTHANHKNLTTMTAPLSHIFTLNGIIDPEDSIDEQMERLWIGGNQTNNITLNGPMIVVVTNVLLDAYSAARGAKQDNVQLRLDGEGLHIINFSCDEYSLDEKKEFPTPDAQGRYPDHGYGLPMAHLMCALSGIRPVQTSVRVGELWQHTVTIPLNAGLIIAGNN